jgi:uncharacterized membrane protein YfhO
MQLPIALPAGSLTPLRQFIYIFALTVVIQAVHLVEHVAQVMQKFVFHVAPAHGLIGQLDLEEVHFAFNLLYLIALTVVMVGWLYYGSQLCSKQKVLSAMLIGTVAVQGYHMLEHSVKLAQFISTGMQGTPGIVGMHFDGVIFHALMNTAVFLPVVVVFFCAGLHQQLFRRAPHP